MKTNQAAKRPKNCPTMDGGMSAVHLMYMSISPQLVGASR